MDIDTKEAILIHTEVLISYDTCTTHKLCDTDMKMIVWYIYIKAVTWWLVFAILVDLGRSQILSGPLDSC